MAVHPTAIVARGAQIDPTADVGPYAIVEDGVSIGPQTRIFPHAFIASGTTLGRGCSVHPFAVVGHWPQDLAWDGAPSYTSIGDETVIREHASVHRGTIPESTTRLGQRCYLMACAHVAHNCVLGDEVKLANSALLAGHVHVGSRAFISGHAAVHQFVRIGELAMITGAGRIVKDVPPFMLVGPAGPLTINVVGLRRAGLSAAERLELRQCHRLLYREGLHHPNAVERVAALVQSEPGRRLLEFLRAPSKRGYLPLRRRAARRKEDLIE